MRIAGSCALWILYGRTDHTNNLRTEPTHRRPRMTSAATSPHVSRRPSQERPPAQQPRPEPVAAPLLPFPLLPAALAASTLVAEVQEGAGGREQVEKTVHNAYTPPIKPCVPAPPVVSSHGSIFCGATAGAGAAARTPADDRVDCINFLKRRGVIKGHETFTAHPRAGCERKLNCRRCRAPSSCKRRAPRARARDDQWISS